jgi:hypothetical protein
MRSNTPSMGTCAIINASTTDSDDKVKSYIDAVQTQVNRDISTYWGYTVNLIFIPGEENAVIPKSDWYAGFFDNSDQIGARAWHDLGPNGEPLIKVFTNDTEDAGLSPSLGLSHEIAESLSDPNANITVQGFDNNGRPALLYREIADPVESTTYQINGLYVSDFVTPNWFVPHSKGPWDFMNQTTGPFQMLQGGYEMYSYDNGASWNEVDKQSKRLAMHKTPNSRWALYIKKHDQRIVSTFRVSSK